MNNDEGMIASSQSPHKKEKTAMRFTDFQIATVAYYFYYYYFIHIIFFNNNITASAMVSPISVSRSIAGVVPPTTANPIITRLVGTVDIDGAGTQHALPHVDPFILLDQGTITKNNMPPFGPHPHRGHSADLGTIILFYIERNHNYI